MDGISKTIIDRDFFYGSIGGVRYTLYLNIHKRIKGYTFVKLKSEIYRVEEKPSKIKRSANRELTF